MWEEKAIDGRFFYSDVLGLETPKMELERIQGVTLYPTLSYKEEVMESGKVGM